MTKKPMALLAALLAAGSAWGHEGHGAPVASHWHATDALGLLVAVALVGVAVWAARRK